jgi:hypothetical protein
MGSTGKMKMPINKRKLKALVNKQKVLTNKLASKLAKRKMLIEKLIYFALSVMILVIPCIWLTRMFPSVWQQLVETNTLLITFSYATVIGIVIIFRQLDLWAKRQRDVLTQSLQTSQIQSEKKMDAYQIFVEPNEVLDKELEERE